MGKVIKVYKEYIDKVMNDLVEIMYCTKDKNVIDKIEATRNFIQTNILINDENDTINIVKKLIYKRMLKSRNINPYENKELYTLYEELKLGKIKYDKAIEKFTEIEKKYNVISDESSK